MINGGESESSIDKDFLFARVRTVLHGTGSSDAGARTGDLGANMRRDHVFVLRLSLDS